MIYRIFILIFLSQTIFAEISLVSINKDNTESGNDASSYPSISGDGNYIAFSSYADNLVNNDKNNYPDIFLRNLQDGSTHLISVSSDGNQTNEKSEDPSISASGRYIAFSSLASNLVDKDENDSQDIFVHDFQNNTTHLVSINSNGDQANDDNYYPSISANGRYIAFSSIANNLVDKDENDSWDIFVHDLQNNTTHLVSINNDGNQANSHSVYPSISADGRYITFSSIANNLVDKDENDNWDIFVHDLQTRTTHLVSINNDGDQANDDNYPSSISANGRYIVFVSYADNLVDNDSNSKRDIFVHDLQTRTTHLVSINSSGDQANDDSYYPSISADGHYIAFYSKATNLVNNDNNNHADTFLHDFQSRTTYLISVNNNGDQADFISKHPSISDDGHRIAFYSGATNLVDNDNNQKVDVFLYVNSLLSGELWGLPYRDSIVIQNNNTDILELTANGPFELISGSADYSLTILEQPQRANCMIYNPAGTIGQIRPIVRCFSRRYR